MNNMNQIHQDIQKLVDQVDKIDSESFSNHDLRFWVRTLQQRLRSAETLAFVIGNEQDPTG